MSVRAATVADAPVIAGIHVETWRTAYRGLVSGDYLASLSTEARERFWAGLLGRADGRDIAVVAEDEGGRVVGFASGGPERSGDPDYRGELYTLYVLQEHQGRGHGRRLLAAVAERLAEAGIHSLILWVLAEGPARPFYEALGGRRLRVQQIELGGATLDEVAYGWPDSAPLIPPRG